MKKFLRATAIGLAIAVTSAGGAFAQAATDTSGRPNFDGLLAALTNYTTAVANLNALATVDPNAVTLLDVGDMVGGNNTTAYVDALGNANLLDIHSAITANATLTNIITSAGVDVSDVVAVSVTTAGAITVYYIGD